MNYNPDLLDLLKTSAQGTEDTYKPIFYRLDNTSDLDQLIRMVQSSEVKVFDFISGQIRELLKTKSPLKRLSDKEIEDQIASHTGHIDLRMYGVWVYYPWSHRLVHILDKDEFIEVRTSRNQYKITREERDVLATKKIGVIGLSVGQSVSVTLIMERICGEIRLADFDLLELTNLNRIRTGIHNLGLPKVYSVAREIAEIDPFIKVICYPDGLNETNLDDFFTKGGNLDLLVEESDGFDIKILSRYKARDLKVPVIMEASDRCMVDVERFDLEPQRQILHGIVKNLDIPTLKTLKTNEEKIPYMLDVLGLETTTARLRASMLEMQQTITTWPQLASAVTMGGGITADVSRRILLNQFTQSGRYYVDIDELIGNKSDETHNHIKAESDKDQLDDGEMEKIVVNYRMGVRSPINTRDIEKVVEAGAMAPSYANRQPWKWYAKEGYLFLFHIGGRGAVIDFENVNAIISLGTAIENVHLMASSLGYDTHFHNWPLPHTKDLVTVVRFTRDEPVAERSALSRFIFLRHTNRKVGNGKPISEHALREMQDAVLNINDARVTFVSGKENLKAIGKIAGVCERIRLLNRDAHNDFFSNELRWEDGKEIREGIDIRTLELPTGAETNIKVASDARVVNLLNKWEKGHAFEKLAYQSISSSAAVGLITMPGSGALDYLMGGRAAERVWLTATKNNLAFQPISLSLSFIRRLSKNYGRSIFSEKHLGELQTVSDQLRSLFNELDEREPVFMFRAFDAEIPDNRSLKKVFNEVFDQLDVHK